MRTICVVGLGYVGLPLAVAFGKKQKTFAFDVNEQRVRELVRGIDTTGEVPEEELKKADIAFSSDPAIIRKADLIVVAVPTPIDNAKNPDLSFIKSATRLVAQNLKKGSIVVYESTVFPGCTEEICVPLIEKVSGLRLGDGFKVGYSPERINPGDKMHSLENVVKIVSGCDEEATKAISEAYSSVVKAGIFKAKSIKVAEAAKVIENTQRDLNIALVNELSIIFAKLGINTYDVLEAASTKWNFLKFFPGLVGGHCIGVDPYYLTYKAKQLGHHPEVILAGRRINDSMASYAAMRLIKIMAKSGKTLKGSKVLVLGLTFKENVPDIRNSKLKDFIAELKQYGINVIAYDPFVSKNETKKVFKAEPIAISLEDLDALERIGALKAIDAIVLAVPHDIFKKLNFSKLAELMEERKIFFDIKGFLRNTGFSRGQDIEYFSL